MNKRIIAILICGYSTLAAAGFVNEASDQVKNPFAEANQVRIFGSQKTFDPSVGIGREVTLNEAVSQIVPKAYSVRFIAVERWQSQKVSWQGGKAWPDVLRDALAQLPSVTADVDGDLRIVTLRPTADVAPAVAAADADGNAETRNQGIEWQLRGEDKTLKTGLMRWAAIANWQLSWEMDVDYPISATASFNGSFENAIEAVVRSMQGAEIPPKVRFYTGNRVVRIVNKGAE